MNNVKTVITIILHYQKIPNKNKNKNKKIIVILPKQIEKFVLSKRTNFIYIYIYFFFSISSSAVWNRRIWENI